MMLEEQQKVVEVYKYVRRVLPSIGWSYLFY